MWGYDYELKTYGDCAYWANDENLFRGNLKKYPVSKENHGLHGAGYRQ